MNARALAFLVLAVGLPSGACGTSAPGPAAPAAAHPPGPAAPGPAAPAAPAAPPTCVSRCLEEYAVPRGPDDDLRGYCDERCAPIEGPSPDCIRHCIQSKEPGAHYDDDGEYQHDEDPRTAAEVAADAAACADSCADVPTVSSPAIQACMAHCDDTEIRCRMDCDPDPFEHECLYMPCD